MTFILEGPGTPVMTEVSTYQVGQKTILLFGDKEISLNDFLLAAFYVLTNTDLDPESDPRPDFVGRVTSLKLTEGYNKNGVRFKPGYPDTETFPSVFLSGSSGNDNTE